MSWRRRISVLVLAGLTGLTGTAAHEWLVERVGVHPGPGPFRRQEPLAGRSR